ncbi:MAG TPA: T9SS type A sorting domain-containing protein, partial [Rhodothermales bacterium]|nr:T9SS type A sorting domain-containing protein [Rhodothermales bacterium]
EGSTDPATIGTGDNNIGLTALWYSNMTGGAAGYGETGGVDIRLNGEYNQQVIPLLPKQASNGWTQYAFVLTPPVRAAGEAPNVGMELRLRYWHAFTGTTYWDDVVIADVADVVAALNNKLSNGGFEANRPAYWAPSGAGATWSTDARSAGRSLGLSGSGASSWTMGEAVRNWTDFIGQHGPNGFTPGEIVISGYVKALGVNTFPAGEENKFQLVLEFFNQAGGTNILGQPVVIDLPQTSANTGGFVKFDNLALGSIILPQAARSVRTTFRKGANATGTMLLDDLTVSAANWPGTIHNGNMDAGDTWYYYTPDAEASYPNGQTFVNGVMASAARTGANGLLIKRNGPVGGGEAVQITQRVPVTAGRPQLITFWLKTANVPNPATIGTGDNNIGLTGLWYTNMTGGAAGYGEVGGFDVRFNGEYNDRVIPNYKNDANGDWKQYAVVAYPPTRGANEPPVVGMELRLRYWHAFLGDAMFDDVSIIDLGGNTLATAAEPGAEAEGRHGTLLTAYPNPFQGRTTLAFQLAQAATVTLDVFDMLGRRVARLADGETMPAGTHLRTLDGTDLTTGTYVCVIRVGDRTDTRLVSLVR